MNARVEGLGLVWRHSHVHVLLLRQPAEDVPDQHSNSTPAGAIGAAGVKSGPGKKADAALGHHGLRGVFVLQPRRLVVARASVRTLDDQRLCMQLV